VQNLHYARYPPFRCRSSVAFSPFCRCKIPLFCKNYVRKFRSVTAVNSKNTQRQPQRCTETATSNGNGETATEWWKPGIKSALLHVIPRSDLYCLSLPLCLEWYNGPITPRVHSAATIRIQCTECRLYNTDGSSWPDRTRTPRKARARLMEKNTQQETISSSIEDN